jgi:hypothetical protein
MVMNYGKMLKMLTTLAIAGLLAFASALTPASARWYRGYYAYPNYNYSYYNNYPNCYPPYLYWAGRWHKRYTC